MCAPPFTRIFRRHGRKSADVCLGVGAGLFAAQSEGLRGGEGLPSYAQRGQRTEITLRELEQMAGVSPTKLTHTSPSDYQIQFIASADGTLFLLNSQVYVSVDHMAPYTLQLHSGAFGVRTSSNFGNNAGSGGGPGGNYSVATDVDLIHSWSRHSQRVFLPTGIGLIGLWLSIAALLGFMRLRHRRQRSAPFGIPTVPVTVSTGA